MKTIRNFFARLFGKAKPVGVVLPPVSWPAPPMPAVKPAKGFAERLNPQVPPRRSPVSPSQAVAAASVPRRAPVSAAAPAPAPTRSATTDEGMSMLPAAMLLSGEDRSAAYWLATSEQEKSAPVSGGGSFDGGGASGNWDSGSSSSSDSCSSSDSSSSSCSSD